MHESPHSLTIGTLAGAADVGVETIRYYQRKSLLPEPQRPPGSVRRYGPADVARVRFIRSAQRTGFSLDEIAQLLQLEDGAQCAQARTIAARRLLDVRHRMADLQRIETALAELVDRCAEGRGRVACPLIASLQEAA